MKKLTLFLLAALLLFAGCADDKPIEYVIYGDSIASEGNTVSTDTVSGNITIKPSSSLDVHHYQGQVINTDSPKARALSLSGTNITYTLTQSMASSIANCDNAAMQKYGTIDQYEYVSDTEHQLVYYRPTGELLFFLNSNELKPIVSEFTETDATKLAAKLIESQYGKEVFAEYSFNKVSTSQSGYIHVIYVKKICDYPTLDSIQITFHGNGKLKCINALQRGIFTPLEDSITTDKIDAAKKVLLERIGGDWEPQEIYLAVGADGKCYLQVHRSFDCTYYININ